MTNFKLLLLVMIIAVFELVMNGRLLKAFNKNYDGILDDDFKMMQAWEKNLGVDYDDDDRSNDGDSSNDRNNRNIVSSLPSGESQNTPALPNQKPWLVLHVGPPKTGTTTIQTGLSSNCGRLAGLDNTFYLGQTHRQSKFTIFKKYKGRNNTKGLLTIFPMYPIFFHDDEVTETLKYHQQQKHNIVLSSEHFTSKFPLISKFVPRFFEKQFDYIFLREGGPAEELIAQTQKPPIKQPNRVKQQTMNASRNGKPKEKAKSSISRRRRLLERSKEIMAGSKSRAQPHRLKKKKLKKKKLELSRAKAVEESRRSSYGYNVDESSHFGFDVKIVVDYRHYFQWLPSYYFQAELINHSNGAQTLREYIENAINRLGNEYLFDDEQHAKNNTTWSQTKPQGMNKIHGPLWSYIEWSSPLSLRHRVDVFDLHQQQIVMNDPNNKNNNDTNDTTRKDPDLLCDFICQALPAAPETCSILRRSNKTLVARARTKGGSVSSLETGKLSDTQVYQLKSAAFDTLEELQTHKNTTRFRDRGFLKPTAYEVDKSNSIFRGRGTMNYVENKILTNFYDWALQRNKNKNNAGSAASEKDDGHRELCLSEASTKALKAVSWNMLRHLEALVRNRDKDRQQKSAASEQHHQQQQPFDIFRAPAIHRPKHPLLLSPRKYDHPIQFLPDNNNNNRDEDWWELIKRSHDDLFEQTVARGAYCELDLPRLFADENFVRQIFYRSEEDSESME